jgi:hypothetical protein
MPLECALMFLSLFLLCFNISQKFGGAFLSDLPNLVLINIASFIKKKKKNPVLPE